MEFNDSVELTKALLLVSLVVFCSATDLSMRRIPNSVLFATLMTALFLNSFVDGPEGLIDSVAGLALGIVVLMPFYLLGRMGAGDVKLLGVVGSILGPWGAVVAGLATMMAGGVLALVYVLWLVAKRLVVAEVAQFVHWKDDKSPERDCPVALDKARAAEIPYAIAIAIGAIAALLHLDFLTEVSVL
jgi:prepilin peptidase CpaA